MPSADKSLALSSPGVVKYNRKTTHIKEAGVVLFRAQTFGVHRPDQIIYSCLSEVEGLDGISELPFPVLRPEELDLRTLQMQQYFTAQAA